MPPLFYKGEKIKMLLKLNIYTDESLTDIKRVVEAEKLKIPYRVAMYIIQSLDGLNLESNEDLIKFVSANIEKMDKIIKATFGVTESELDCIDSGELLNTIKELYQWAAGKMNELKSEEGSKNLVAPAKI